MYTLWTVCSSNVLAANEDLNKTLNARLWLQVAQHLKKAHPEGSLIYAYSGFNKLILVFKSQDIHDITPYKFLLKNSIRSVFRDANRYWETGLDSDLHSVTEKKLDKVEEVLYYIKDISTFSIQIGKQLGVSIHKNNSLTGASLNLTGKGKRPRYNKDSFTSCMNEFLVSEGLAEQGEQEWLER